MAGKRRYRETYNWWCWIVFSAHDPIQLAVHVVSLVLSSGQPAEKILVRLPSVGDWRGLRLCHRRVEMTQLVRMPVLELAIARDRPFRHPFRVANVRRTRVRAFSVQNLRLPVEKLWKTINQVLFGDYYRLNQLPQRLDAQVSTNWPCAPPSLHSAWIRAHHRADCGAARATTRNVTNCNDGKRRSRFETILTGGPLPGLNMETGVVNGVRPNPPPPPYGRYFWEGGVEAEVESWLCLHASGCMWPIFTFQNLSGACDLI